MKYKFAVNFGTLSMIWVHENSETVQTLPNTAGKCLRFLNSYLYLQNFKK